MNGSRRLHSQQKAPGQGLGYSGLRGPDLQPSGLTRPTLRRAPHDKAGPRVYARALAGSIASRGTQETRMKRVSCIWYRGGDSNPYSLWPLPPQGSVSTNSTTSAKLCLTAPEPPEHHPPRPEQSAPAEPEHPLRQLSSALREPPDPASQSGQAAQPSE